MSLRRRVETRRDARGSGEGARADPVPYSSEDAVFTAIPARLRALPRALVLAALALAATGAAVAGGAIPGGDGVIHGCHNPSGGLRVIDKEATPAQACSKSEKALSWNKEGPQG